MKKFSLISIAIALMSMTAFAQRTNSYDTIHNKGNNYTQQHQPQQGQTDQNVKDFIQTASENGMLYLKLGQLAQQKSSSEEVKDLARKMVDYHTTANQKLQNIAMGMNVNVDQKLSSKDQQMIDQLSQKSGDEFDKAFLNQTIQDHKEDISKMKEEKQEVKNTKLDNWIESSLPVLQQHLQTAESLQGKKGDSDTMRK